MSLKLYFNPRSRAVIAKWMLDECGADYEIVPIDFSRYENRTAAFLAISPAGKLPALVDGSECLFESSAICLYLAERFPAAGLAPPVGDARRGRYLSLMVYATSQLEPAMGDVLMGLPTPRQRGWTDFEAVKDAIERELGDAPYLLGERFSAADVMVGSMFIWMRLWGRSTGRDRLEAYVERLLARPHAMKLE